MLGRALRTNAHARSSTAVAPAMSAADASVREAPALAVLCDDAIGLIDATLARLAGRELVSATDAIDVLLDLRGLLTRESLLDPLGDLAA